MVNRSLSEIAYDHAACLIPELDPSMIDAALSEVGLDPADQKERTRFVKLFEAAKPLCKLDVLARYRFSDDARAMLGSNATDEEVINLAIELERMSH